MGMHLTGPSSGQEPCLLFEDCGVLSAERLEREGFADFIAGSSLTLDEMVKRARTNCYLTADEALDLGLIAALVD